MDLVNKHLAALGELVRSMSPGARITAAVSLALVAASAVWLFGHQARGPDTYLMGGETFSAAQLRDMQTAFGKAGIEGYTIDESRVRVPHGQQSKYMAALADEGALPEDFGEYLRKAVSTNGFMLYGAQQEAQTKVAVQSELQLVISRMKGIKKAFVHIAEETNRGFPQTKTVTASVGVEPHDDLAIDDATVAAIRSFVASAWGGLKPEAVTVVDLSGNRLFAGSGGESKTPAAAGDYAGQKRELELDWQTKISRALAIPGALVTANVELDPHGRRPCDVSLSVAVPQAHYEEIWRKRRATAPARAVDRASAAELAAIEQAEQRRIEAAVLPLLGPPEPGQRRARRIAVSTIASAVVAQAAEQTGQDRVLVWLAQHWHALGFCGLILVGLLVLRSTIKPAPAPLAAGSLTTAESPRASMAATDAGPPALATVGAAHAPQVVPAEALRGELVDAVRHDPRAAAGVIRSWLGSAS